VMLICIFNVFCYIYFHANLYIVPSSYSVECILCMYVLMEIPNQFMYIICD
jgi:hypothetical protein